MGFAGVKNPTERANLIAYLRTLADTPAPLPEAPAPAAEPASAPADAAAPAEPAAPAEAAPAEPAPAPQNPLRRPLNDKIVMLEITKKPGSARLFLLDEFDWSCLASR